MQKLCLLPILFALAVSQQIHAQSRWLKGMQLYGGPRFYISDRWYPQIPTSYQGRDIGLGLMVGRRLGPRSPFTLMSGLNLVRHQYTQRGEARNYVNPYGDYIRFDQYYEWQTQGHQYHFEAPLTLKYRLRKFNRRWSPFVQAGLLFAVEAANKSTYTRSDGFTRNYRDAYFHDLTVGSLVGVGAEFQVTQRVHLMVQPIGSLVNILPSDNGGSRPDTFYGLSLGIYYW